MILLYFLALHCLCISLHAQPVAEPNSDEPAPVLGGLTDADVNGDDVKSAAAFALSEIDKRQNSAFKQVLVQIVSAKTQVVSGLLYHLQLEVGASNCRKGKDDAGSECALKEDSNNQLCDVQVWEKPGSDGREVTKVSCSPKPSKQKRSAETQETLVGGPAEADVSDADVKSAADFALAEVDKRSNSAYKQTLVKILSAKKQVVAGTLYHLRLEIGESSCDKGSSNANSECSLREGSNNQICNVKVWDRPWLNKREVTQVDCSAKSERRRRTAENQRPLAGGLKDADVNDADIKSAANFALTEVDKRSNSAYKQTLVKIVSAKKQVVAGTAYHLQLEIGESNCDKGSSNANSECTLREGSKNQICSVKVWDRPWLNKREVTQVDCSEKSERRRRMALPESIPGGLQNANINDEAVKNAAAFAVREIGKQQNSEYQPILVKIASAQTQVVAGTKYYLELEIGESNCAIGNNAASSGCTVKSNSNNQICNVEIYEVPWENKQELSKVNCALKSGA